ncbi:Nrap protein-domain-containing protein [Phakopsora pachyrhizi]|nr:Nrap protein-domain-containing protein [Phakopsora pachyrhizi]
MMMMIYSCSKPSTLSWMSLVISHLFLYFLFFILSCHSQHCYFHKRAHYLSHLAVFLNKLPLLKDYELSFGYLHEDHLKPIIVIQPKDNFTKSINRTIRLILLYPISEFPLLKLLPSQANLKASSEPSSDYNQSVLMDSTEINL